MELANVHLVLSILVSVIPALHSLSYDECSRRTDQCLDRFNGLNRGSSDFCQEGDNAVQCVRRLDCPNMMYGLMSFRRVQRTLYNAGYVRCELGNFLQECANSQALRKCVVTYTDRIIAHTSRGLVDKKSVCQDMNDYVECQLNWDGARCQVTRSTLRDFIQTEKTRMAITDCEIPGLNRAGLAGHVSLLVVTLTTLVSCLMPGSTSRF
ncbi:hypothetical protein RRG08_060172 [Elysia crispata]|uniref:Uncharacterized protein n=1 Tax=Elysia crispata TaxID=231223 RepID=A0AAE1DPE8_9GAST|nr:hypothetical protein RRG08_060172 [Elysia crispata]